MGQAGMEKLINNIAAFQDWKQWAGFEALPEKYV